MQDYISLDFETTGFQHETSDIIEVGAWKVQNGVVTDKFVTLVRPVIYIPRQVQSLTGITMEDVEDCETIEPILLEFFDWCGDLPFLGHNLGFDYKFLCHKGKFVGLDFSIGGQRRGIDTLDLSRSYLNLEHNKLEDVARHFGIQLAAEEQRNGYHRAGYDSYIVKLVYDRFLAMAPGLPSIAEPKLLSVDDGKYGRATNYDTLSFD